LSVKRNGAEDIIMNAIAKDMITFLEGLVPFPSFIFFITFSIKIPFFYS